MGYTTWPGSYSVDANARINICYKGNDEVTEHLPLMEKASTLSHTIKVVKLDTHQYQKCHILYIALSQERHIGRILNAIKTLPILSISSVKSFIKKGGIIGFTSQESRLGMFKQKMIGFEVNKQALDEARLRINPVALQFSVKVIE